LLRRIESDREVILDFFRGFIRRPSPNPTSGTRDAAGHIRQLLARHAVDYRGQCVLERRKVIEFTEWLVLP